jgi:hypothetical protein
MTPTSDERRDVARKLRGITPIDLFGYESLYGGICNAVARCIGFDKNPDSVGDFIYRLADLIDPTCRDFGGEEGTNGECYDFACSACGYVCDLAEPRFCPNCGARVVSEDA